MTEEEAKIALFNLHKEYMKHTPKERLTLYNEYKIKRQEVRDKLIQNVMKKKEKIAKAI